jgi:queuine tRNA-ribosyltransferase
LAIAGEILSARLNTIHNLYFYQSLMRTMQKALAAGRFADFARPFLEASQPREKSAEKEEKICQV